ncbi:MAG: hypothetical protein IJY04_04870 [Clostridia bacterium]|nr:hypothetical protein [Clostridia bacterium]
MRIFTKRSAVIVTVLSILLCGGVGVWAENVDENIDFRGIAASNDADCSAEENVDSEIDGEETGDSAGITAPNVSEGAENADEFNRLMTELYEYWLSYSELEGDNAFEKAVELAWRSRGDIGGLSAAAAVLILIVFAALKLIPSFRHCVNYVGLSNANAKSEIEKLISDELGKYAPSLETVQRVSELYGDFERLTGQICEGNVQLLAAVEKLGAELNENEERNAAVHALHGETFRDLILLSALPAEKKAEIMENYRAISVGSTVSGQS